MGRFLRTVAAIIPVRMRAEGGGSLTALPVDGDQRKVANTCSRETVTGRAEALRPDSAQPCRTGAMAMEQVQVRFATPEDEAVCAKFDPHLPRFRFRSKIECRELLLAEVQGRPEGYLRLEYLWGKVPFIGMIVVSHHLRGKGIGKAMLTYLEDHLRDEGYRTLLSSSQVNEAEPQAWHRARGFQECGIISGINEGSIGEVFFRKELKAGLSPRD